jgi:pimeloyl-ACP methyl ester carboxylesterase
VRTLRWILAAVLALFAAFAGAVGWMFSDTILVPAPYGLMPEFELIDVRAGEDGAYRVTLPLPGEAPPQMARTDVRGRYGLLWEGGAGRLGDVLERGDGRVVRAVVPTRGAPPEPGDPARVDVTLFGPDPAARGLAFEEVAIPGPVGDLPGWWLAGGGDGRDAVLVLHGRRRADRTEALRILPTLVETGASVLVASYRNHDASPPSPDGFYHYGASEADDAVAAARWLARRGVRRVALVGFSMGGSVAIGALDRWPDDAPRPVALVLDSPLIDPLPAFTVGARDMGLPAPGLLAGWATRVAGWRSGVDFAGLDRRGQAPALDLPVLLVAGVDDGTVPIAVVDAFAAALPRPPTYLRLDGVEHVEGWNADPDRYEAAVRTFLAPRVGGAGP